MLSDSAELQTILLADEGLNPCSNGICSLTSATQLRETLLFLRLNPCSNGICSLTTAAKYMQGHEQVS